MRVNNINMMSRKLLIVALLIVSVEVASHEGEDETIEREINQILQITIDAPELQQYYHRIELPERAPLVLKLPNSLSSITLTSVEKFGHPVELYQPGMTNPYFEILTWKVSSYGISFDATYAVEGLGMIYEFEKRDGSWQISKLLLWEN